MTKDAEPKEWVLDAVGGRRYSDPDNEPGSEENPDGYSTGSVLIAREFVSVNVPNNGPITDGGSTVLATWEHQPTGAWDGGPCYQCTLSQDGSGVVGIEQQQGSGLKWWPLDGMAADSCQILAIGFELELSQTFIDEFTTFYTDLVRQAEAPPPANSGLGGYLYGSCKFLDVSGYNSAGTGIDDNTRQVIGLIPVYEPSGGHTYSPSSAAEAPIGLYLAAQNGGAGGPMIYDGVNTPFDFTDYGGVAVFVCIVMDSTNGDAQTIIYCKPEGGELVKSVHRTASMQCGSGGTYAFNHRGWAVPSAYNSYIAGYWQRIRNAHAGVSLKISNVVCASGGWIPPPAGF